MKHINFGCLWCELVLREIYLNDHIFLKIKVSFSKLELIVKKIETSDKVGI